MAIETAPNKKILDRIKAKDIKNEPPSAPIRTKKNSIFKKFMKKSA